MKLSWFQFRTCLCKGWAYQEHVPHSIARNSGNFTKELGERNLYQDCGKRRIDEYTNATLRSGLGASVQPRQQQSIHPAAAFGYKSIDIGLPWLISHRTASSHLPWKCRSRWRTRAVDCILGRTHVLTAYRQKQFEWMEWQSANGCVVMVKFTFSSHTFFYRYAHTHAQNGNRTNCWRNEEHNVHTLSRVTENNIYTHTHAHTRSSAAASLLGECFVCESIPNDLRHSASCWCVCFSFNI